mmetsp:Transcript_69344/g.219412  ORF Transcript_69344/g.219412 Transcript_69344/m.219412 type:complete len:896 (-) Transcript_69344:944-3631(-)
MRFLTVALGLAAQVLTVVAVDLCMDVQTNLDGGKNLNTDLIRPLTHLTQEHPYYKKNACGMKDKLDWPKPKIPHDGPWIKLGGRLQRPKKKWGQIRKDCEENDGGTVFYAYEYPVPWNFNGQTSILAERTEQIFFIQDDQDWMYVVWVHGKQNAAVGGHLQWLIDSPDIGAMDPEVNVLSRDDPYSGSVSSDEFSCLATDIENIEHGEDCFAWGPSKGQGSFSHKWKSCCTDGMVLGRFRTLDFCFNIRYTEIWNVDTLGIGNYRNGNLEMAYYPMSEFVDGGKLCAQTCETHCRRKTSCGECSASEACSWCGDTGTCLDNANSGACPSGLVPSGGSCEECSSKSTCGSCTGTEGCGWCYSTGTCFSAGNVDSDCPSGFLQLYEDGGDNTCKACPAPIDSSGAPVVLATTAVADFCSGNGECDWGSKTCSCDKGFLDSASGCSTQCPGGSFLPCSGNGVCMRDSTGAPSCTCKCGWTGPLCDQVSACPCTDSTCYYDSNLDADACKIPCGKLLSTLDCAGVTNDQDECVCSLGFWGPSCENACPGVDPDTGEGESCGPGGTCNPDGSCACDPCYSINPDTGSCELDPPPECVAFQGKPECTASGWQCGCRGQFTGPTCDECACLNDGVCNVVSGACNCVGGYTGNKCQYEACTREASCSGNGECTLPEYQCICDAGWMGPDDNQCSVYCLASDTCSGHGTCTRADGSCNCAEEFDGAACDKCAEGFSGYPDCLPTTEPCYEGDGSAYRGRVAVSMSGYYCQAWASQSPHAHVMTPENNPGDGLDVNFCRNPGSAQDKNSGPWCFVNTNDGTRSELCEIPRCPVPAAAAAAGGGGGARARTTSSPRAGVRTGRGGVGGGGAVAWPAATASSTLRRDALADSGGPRDMASRVHAGAV